MGQFLRHNQRRALRAYADTGMRIASAAARAHISRGAMRRRLASIHKDTGINPQSVWGLACLLQWASWVPKGDMPSSDIRARAMFFLWQLGCTDAMIAPAFGVSRQIVQRWRDGLELPPTCDIDAEDRWLCKITRNPVGGDWVAIRCNPGKRRDSV